MGISDWTRLSLKFGRSQERHLSSLQGLAVNPSPNLETAKDVTTVRASCLPKALRAVFLLQSKVVVLECVAPAGHDGFVKQEVDHFTSVTGFSCSQVDLKLDDIWPCRHHRTWWLLVSPEIGPIELETWKAFQNVDHVCQVIPNFQLWDVEDEEALRLDVNERAAFGVDDSTYAKHLLNGRQTAQCAGQPDSPLPLRMS